MLTIDGSRGEGGGQILRTAHALAPVTRTPFRIENLRARRDKPGLMRQHLAAVRAAGAVGNASMSGNEVGSQALEFHPRDILPGSYRFSVGTAGSATLVLQTVLPALLKATAPSTLLLEGGTHNPLAPTFDFLDRVYLPLLERMGVEVSRTLVRPGFYPAGGGQFEVTIKPHTLTRIDLLERGEIRGRRATAMFADLPFDIARRELATVRERLGWEDGQCRPLEVTNSMGPGNVVQIEIESEHITELFSGFGVRGVRAEEVAGNAASEAAEYLAAGVPVGWHLADQLLLPLALAGGSFRSFPATAHTDSQIEVIRHFLGTQVSQVWHFECCSQ